MNKIRLTPQIFLILVITVLISSCNTPKPQTCDCCNAFGGSTQKAVLTVYGNSVLIKVPSAFTPNNYQFCDSSYDRNGNPFPKKIQNCRNNVDSIYNDNVNERFYIAGIDSFPINKLLIRSSNGDTTAIGTFYNYKNSVTESFVGLVSDTTLRGNKRERQLTSGKYKFILQVYRTNSYEKVDRIDSISGFFCIIRKKDFCNVGCEGNTKNDPLIK